MMPTKKSQHYISATNNSKHSIKYLQNKVMEYFIKYNRCQIEIQYYDSIIKNCSKNITSKDDLIQYVNYIDEIINHLSEDAQEIFKNEFVVSNNNSWWERKYNRSKYFKVKKNALSEFLLYAS